MTEARQTIRLYEALDCAASTTRASRRCATACPRRARTATCSPAARTISRAGPRDQLRALEFKRRKLNASIQRANFEHRIEQGGEDLSLTEALETRKALNDHLGELHTQVVDSAYERVLHKEERDIVEENELPYDDCRTRLDEARVEFRRLNRQIRAASFEVEVEYADEEE